MICKKCGKAREKIYRNEKIIRPRPNLFTQPTGDRSPSPNDFGGLTSEFLGYTDCGCGNYVCNTCGIVLDYDRGNNNAIRKQRKAKGIPKELGTEALPENESPRALGNGDIFLQGEGMPNMPYGILREENASSVFTEMRSQAASIEGDAQQVSNTKRALSELQRWDNKQGWIQGNNTQRETHDGAPSGNGKLPNAGINQRRGSASQEWGKGRQPVRESGAGNQEGTQRNGEMSTLPNAIQDQITCPECGQSMSFIHSPYEPGIVHFII